jgi:hypothetical protein
MYIDIAIGGRNIATTIKRRNAVFVFLYVFEPLQGV